MKNIVLFMSRLLLLALGLGLAACAAQKADEWSQINYAEVACSGPTPPEGCHTGQALSAVGGSKR